MAFTLKTFRFNKCPPINSEVELKDGNKKLYREGVHEGVFPLLQSDYAEGLEKKEKKMREETKSESIVLSNDPGLLDYKDKTIELFCAMEDPVTKFRVVPLFPGDRSVDGRTFWDEFREVIKAQKARRNGLLETRDSSLYSWPELWFKSPEISPWPRNMAPRSDALTLDDVAQSVKGEFSNYHQQAYLRSILGDKKEPVDLSTDMGQPFRCVMDFLAKPIRMAAVNAWSLDVVGPVNFNLKWHFGLPRPEEVAWLIHEDSFTTNRDNALESVPEDVVDTIKAMNLQDATDFTAYPGDGSPMHPSFPAMHSAGSTCSLWVPALYDISDEQYLEALRTDYGVAFARTVAGVHYPQDNIAGLNIGQRVVRERLPDFLSENYDYDPDLVKRKVEKLSFDWNKVEFTKDGCIIDGKSHIQFLQDAKDAMKTRVASA